MAVYTIEFWYRDREEYGPGLFVPFFTAPSDGNTYVLRDFSLYVIPGDDTMTVQMLLYPGGGAPGPVTLWDTALEPPGVTLKHWEGRQFVRPAGSVGIFPQGDFSIVRVDSAATGYKLGP